MTDLVKIVNNVQIIGRAVRDLGLAQFHGMLDVGTGNVLWAVGEDSPAVISGNFSGNSSVKEFFYKIDECIDYSSFEPKNFFSDQEAVVVLGRHTGIVRWTGKTYDHNWCMVFRKNEKKYNYYVFVDSPEHAKSFILNDCYQDIAS